jgi:hypothetical protein
VPKKENAIGECKLCGVAARLLQSHIIPKFLYREAGIIGDKKKFDMPCLNFPERSLFNKQDGFKEHLFCDECETKRLSPLERYARQKFYGPGSPLKSVPANGFFWSGLDYAQMNLFTVSILWRMSLSSHDLYSKVDLGEKHENRMRKMLMTKSPMEPWRYGCAIGFLMYGEKPLGGVISQPQRHSVEGIRNLYRFVMAGFAWFYHVASHRPVKHDDEGYLRESGVWPVPVVQALSIPFVKGELVRFRQHHKAREDERGAER